MVKQPSMNIKVSVSKNSKVFRFYVNLKNNV